MASENDFTLENNSSNVTQGAAISQADFDNNTATLGLAGVIGSSTGNTIPPQNLPWQAGPKTQSGAGKPVTSVFFSSIDIDGRRWDQLFPYRLLVIDVTKGNQIVNGSDPSKLKIAVTKGTSSAIVDFTNFNNQWIFELPITPQQLNIQDVFAINTSATLRGILEEHNGVRFKMINATGTMGVWPRRTSVSNPPTTPSLVQSLFGGTIEALGTLQSQVQGVINTATTGHPANKPVTIRPDSSGVGPSQGLVTTGYYNALKLQQFLEQYAEAKKDPANTGWRLVFDIPKQNQSLIVTPNVYTWQQNANKGMEISYSMQLKAWRRVDLNETPKTVPSNVQPISPGILQRILNTITTARSAASAALNLIGAVRSDVETPLTALRQTSLLVKNLAGVVISAADLPSQVQRDYQNAISNFFTSLSINNLAPNVSSNSAVVSAIMAIQNAAALSEGLGTDAVSNGQLGNNAIQNQASNPAYNVFLQPEANYDLMDQVPVDSLNLSTVQQNQVNVITQAASQLTVNDLKQFRATIQQLALQLSNNFGSGDAYYSMVYGQPAPTVRLTPITLDDYDLLKAMYDVMQSYDILVATTQIDDDNNQSNMEYVAGLATTSGIQFNIPNSMVLAPVPFGLTIEAIAARYLGDPQRWLEIVTLNNLRDPYIDEDGFQIPLLSNANGRQIIIGNDQNLYLGQNVILQSPTQMPSPRSILGISQLSDTSFLITLDGLANLENFLLADEAYLQAYLPGTVNSQQKIFIPSDLPVPSDANILIPSVAAQDPLSGMSKVDWLLTDSGDLAVNNYGDFRYSYGITNIMQALKIKFGVVQGTWLTHSDFGLGIRPGTINSTIKIQDIYNSINQLIQKDPRFSSVSNLQISLNGPILSISVGVQISGQNGVFPITFQLVS